MRTLRVAIVGRDPATRQAAAEAFDDAPSCWDVALFDTVPARSDAVVRLPDAQGIEGILFDPDRPEATLEELRAVLSKEPPAIGVWAACPGAGATTLAVHLAAALAGSGGCYLVDLDPARGAARRLGCPPLDADAEDAALKARPVAGGFRLIEGELPSLDPMAAEWILVDGPGEMVRAAGCGRHVIVVPSGRVGVERAREVLAAVPLGPVGVVINRTGWGGELTRSAIERLLQRRVALELPPSPGLRDAEDRSELLTSAFSPWLNRVRRLARAL